MKDRRTITGFVLIGIAITALINIRQLPIGKLMSPETGFFPLVIATLLGILSLIYLAKAIKAKDDWKAPSWVTSGGWRRLGFTIGFILSYTIFFEWLGYLVSTFLFIGLLLKTVGGKRWWIAIVASLITTICCYFLFTFLLGTPLPMGIFRV